MLHAARNLLLPAEHNPGKDLLEALAGAAEDKVNAFTSQNISNLVLLCPVGLAADVHVGMCTVAQRPDGCMLCARCCRMPSWATTQVQ